MKLYDHQAKGVEILKKNPRYALWWEAGIGKTLTVLKALEEIDEWPALVITKKSILYDAWASDAEKFCDGMNLQVAAGGAKERHTALDRTRQLCVANYEAVVGASYERFWNIPWKTIVLDESTAIKGATTKVSDRIRMLCRKQHVTRVWALSGCPAPNHQLDLWPQFDAIKPGLLEATFYSHRASRYYQPRREITWLWVPMNGQEGRLTDELWPYCNYLKAKECLDLPDHVDVVERVDLDKKEQRIYNEMLRHWVTEVDNCTIIGQTALSELMKLRQITAGLAQVGQGGKQDWRVISGTKLKWVLDKLNTDCRTLDGRARKAIVVGVFRFEIERYVDEISKSKSLKRTAAALYGGLTDAQRLHLIREFQEGELDTLVVHPAAMAHGITLTAASTMLFPSLDYSYEHYVQVRKRIDRIGQDQNCRYLHCLGRNTVDEQIYEALLGHGKRTSDMVRDFRERVASQYPIPGGVS